eukprot:4729044-Pleurochrysis_carterae.AAC.3
MVTTCSPRLTYAGKNDESPVATRLPTCILNVHISPLTTYSAFRRPQKVGNRVARADASVPPYRAGTFTFTGHMRRGFPFGVL